MASDRNNPSAQVTSGAHVLPDPTISPSMGFSTVCGAAIEANSPGVSSSGQGIISAKIDTCIHSTLLPTGTWSAPVRTPGYEDGLNSSQQISKDSDSDFDFDISQGLQEIITKRKNHFDILGSTSHNSKVHGWSSLPPSPATSTSPRSPTNFGALLGGIMKSGGASVRPSSGGRRTHCPPSDSVPSAAHAMKCSRDAISNLFKRGHSMPAIKDQPQSDPPRAAVRPSKSEAALPRRSSMPVLGCQWRMTGVTEETGITGMTGEDSLRGVGFSDEAACRGQSVQTRAGEDRVHVEVSGRGYLFTGVYDGFYGAQAAEFLEETLYQAVAKELDGLLVGWEAGRTPELRVSGNGECQGSVPPREGEPVSESDLMGLPLADRTPTSDLLSTSFLTPAVPNDANPSVAGDTNREEGDVDPSSPTSYSRAPSLEIWGEGAASAGRAHHQEVLQGIERAIAFCEEAWFEVVREQHEADPELSLAGSCVLVAVMTDHDIYIANLGDSRAVVVSDAETSAEDAEARPAGNGRWLEEEEEEMGGDAGRQGGGLAKAPLTPEDYLNPASSSRDPLNNPSSASADEPLLVLNGFSEGGGGGDVREEGGRPPRNFAVVREDGELSGMEETVYHSQPPSPSGASRSVCRERMSAPLDWSGKTEEGEEELRGVSANQSQPFRKRVRVCQLSMDHNTEVAEEVARVRKEHPNDPHAMKSERVKGKVKITRAFGAAFLKKREWNARLLGVFQVAFVGEKEYVSSTPHLCHHAVKAEDEWLVLSSDGLYQFMGLQDVAARLAGGEGREPLTHPAEDLARDALLRAAEHAGMSYSALLAVSAGERRSFHDDISIIVIRLNTRNRH